MSLVTGQCLLMSTESWSVAMSTNRGHVMTATAATDNGVHDIIKKHIHDFIDNCHSFSLLHNNFLPRDIMNL